MADRKPTTDATEPLLSVKDLAVGFQSEDEVLKAVRGASFSVRKGEILGVVGESGCGKSVTALSILRLLPHPSAKVISGTISFKGSDLLQLPTSKMADIRGNRIAMIFQVPMTALNPVMRIGDQLMEAIVVHQKSPNRNEAEERCLQLLQRVGISEGERRFRQYPHQLSGGMRQRVMIAIALACEPDLLIADEPTTALDVTVQAQILDLIVSLQKESGMGVIFITHDLGVVAEICDRVVVMYRGRIIEEAPIAAIFSKPCHPYTKGLMDAIPKPAMQPKTKLSTIDGSVPPLKELVIGCEFANRCQHKTDRCAERPRAEVVDKDHLVACHHWRGRQ